MSTQRRQLTESGSIPSLLPCRRCASSMAASRLLAAPIAWMSPVKWRFRSSIGTTCAYPPPGRAALDPEDRAERGLAQAERHAPADVAEPLRERDRGRRLALAGLRRRDRRDADELAVRPVGEAIDDRQVDLGLVLAVEVVLVRLEAQLLGDLGDRAECRLLRDLQAARHRGHRRQCWLQSSPSVSQCETAAAASSDTRVSVWKRSSANGAISFGVSPVATSSASVVPTIGAALKP